MMKSQLEGQAEISSIEEELRDFLSADMLDVPVDPQFKERLRRELWEIVEQNAIKWRAIGVPPKRDESDS